MQKEYAVDNQTGAGNIPVVKRLLPSFVMLKPKFGFQ